jgi:hypothetical protein
VSPPLLDQGGTVYRRHTLLGTTKNGKGILKENRFVFSRSSKKFLVHNEDSIMALKPEHLKHAKAALKSMSAQREKRLTRADFVTGLIKDIHAKMTAGFTLEEICEELNKALPDGEQLKMNTFKTYVRKARTEAGVAPTRAWTRRTGPAPARVTTTPDKGRPKVSNEDPATDFRDQGGAL